MAGIHKKQTRHKSPRFRCCFHSSIISTESHHSLTIASTKTKKKPRSQYLGTIDRNMISQKKMTPPYDSKMIAIRTLLLLCLTISQRSCVHGFSVVHPQTKYEKFIYHEPNSLIFRKGFEEITSIGNSAHLPTERESSTTLQNRHKFHPLSKPRRDVATSSILFGQKKKQKNSFYRTRKVSTKRQSPIFQKKSNTIQSKNLFHMISFLLERFHEFQNKKDLQIFLSEQIPSAIQIMMVGHEVIEINKNLQYVWNVAGDAIVEYELSEQPEALQTAASQRLDELHFNYFINKCNKVF